MHSAITAIDAKLAAGSSSVMMRNKPLTHEVQYLIFIYVNMLCAYISHKSSSSSSSSSKHISCGHILYAKITSLLHPLHIRPDLY